MARAQTTLDTTQIARLFDITPRHVRRLTSEGVLTRARDENGEELRGRYDLAPNMHAFVKHLKAMTRVDDASESRYAQLRNQKMEAESIMAQLKLKEIKGEMHNAKDVEFVMTNMITATKNHLLAIPSRVARLLVGETKFQKIYDLLYKEIEVALKELSHYKPQMFSKTNDEFLKADGADPSSLNGEGETNEDEEEDKKNG